MSDTEARIRIDFSKGELELEGTEEFVERHLDLLAELEPPSETEKNSPHTTSGDEENEDLSSEDHMNSSLPEVPEHFGEWFHLFTHNDLARVDEALIAGYYIQCRVDEEDFSTSNVTDTLDEVDINQSNTSQSIKNLLNNNRSYKTRKDGGKQFYKVSREGRKYLQDLLEDPDQS